MSLIHQALNRPDPPDRESQSEFNPLTRPPRRGRAGWWWVTAVAAIATLSLLGYQGWQALRTPALVTTAQQTPAPVKANQAVARVRQPETPAQPDQKDTVKPIAPTVPVESVEPSQPVLADTSPPPESQSPPKADTLPAEPKPVPVQPESPNPASAETTVSAEPEPVSAQTANEPSTAEMPKAEQAQSEAVTDSAPSATTPAAAKATVKPAPPPPAPEIPEANPVKPAQNPDQALESQVQNALNQGELERAEGLLKDWIARSPGAEMPRLWLAKIYLSNGLTTAAEPLLNGLGSVEALGLRGLLLEKTGRYQEASRVFEHLTRKEPGTPGWWLHWAINQENSGQLAKARILYQTFLKEFSAYNANLTAFARERYQALEGW